MAPELRPRKSSAPLSKVVKDEKSATPKPAKAQKPAKRKATEDDSSAATKKQKSVKTPSKAKDTKKAEEDVTELPVADTPAAKSTAKSPAAKPSTAKSPAAKPSTAKSPAAKSPAVKSTPAKSPAAKVAAAKSPAAKASTAKSPATKSPAPKAKKSKKDEPKAVVEAEEKAEAVEEDDPQFPDEEVDEQTKALVLAIDNGGEEEQVPKEADAFKKGQDVGEVPKISKKEKKALKAAASAEKEEPGVIYIGRLPHGFYEHELKSYFSQFGPIRNLRLSRNKKSGKSKHFAFVEFEEASTAEIVAKTMDHYLLFGHILRCSVISKAQVHADLFKGANRRFKSIPYNKMEGKSMEKPQLDSKWEAKVAAEAKKRAARAEKLKALGYEFNGPELKSAVASAKAAAAAKAIAAAGEAKYDTPKAIEAPAALVEEPAAVEVTEDVVMTEEVVEEVPVVPEAEEQVTPAKPIKKTRAKTPKSEKKVTTVTSERKVTRTRKAKA